ncbi:hypothetical protein [Endozoicomonas sp. ALB091]|uniref:hypothetical protein n=1 Tax=Endozoicomonas sp. ALB091 TaxID=3403073 RepID=UPI003BB6EBAF
MTIDVEALSVSFIDMDSLPKAVNSFSTAGFANPESCPVPPGKQSNPETAHCEPPGNREQLRQELLDAVKAGTLGARQIRMSSAKSGHARFKKESDYLDHKDKLPKGPRPVILIMEDVPTILRPNHVTVGLIKPGTLAAYKKNAITSFLENNAVKPDELSAKCLPDHSSLQKKMEERAKRICTVYQGSSSGKLRWNGTFKPPEFREKDYEKLTCHSEWLTTGYKKSQIKCFLTAKEDLGKDITDHLQDKHQLEETFGIDPLPWLVYSQQSGSAEVYFEDEVSGHLSALHKARLTNFSISHIIAEETFRQVLNFLPMPLRAKTLNQQHLPAMQYPCQDIIKLVTNPDFNHQHLRELIDQIWKLIDQDFPVEKTFLYKGKWQTVLDLLIQSATTLWLQDHHRSMSLYYNQQEHRGERADEEDVFFQLSTELARRGVSFDEKNGKHLLREFYSIRLCCRLKALGLSYKGGDLGYLITDVPFFNDPAVMLEFHQRCQRLSSAELQEVFDYVLRRPFQGYHPYDQLKNYLLALFRFGEPDEQIFSAVREKIADTGADGIEQSLGTLCADDYIHWAKELRERRDQEPFYQQWPENIKKGQQQIDELRKSFGLTGSQSAQPASLMQPAALQFIVDAFSQPPVLPNAKDNEETILRILQHYYRRPGPERVIQCLGRETLPVVWKSAHSCSHVLRARNNLLWYIELLDKFDPMQFSDIEKNLLSLAIIYHDAAAEDVPKRDEEARAADYFKRDLKGQYPQQQLDGIAEALASKEDDVHGKSDQTISPSVRRYLRVLRFADRMDYIRCTGVDASFPGFCTGRHPLTGFDPRRLDLPSQLTRDFTGEPALKPDFQRQLEAAMHGAADLLQVTGSHSEDCRADSYIQTYHLKPDRTAIKEKFELTPLPLQNMENCLDDNVRRFIASRAGIHTCSSPDHKDCKTDRQNGITRGIHNSFHDLRQVQVPTGMTRLEKMQCRQGFSLLSMATQEAIAQEVQRLQSEGILMSLGTLTQQTLKSPPAKQVLEQRGFAVISEKRFRGYDDTGKVNLQEMLVPIPVGSVGS